jgi:uncharacterized membrane protein YeaQ/YmgE (transglycosylase-associated protein family)
MTALVIFIVVGAIAGWLAGMLFKGTGFGLLGDIVVGILGSVLGGWIARYLHIHFLRGTLGHLIVATLGAFILLFIIKLIRKRT